MFLHSINFVGVYLFKENSILHNMTINLAHVMSDGLFLMEIFIILYCVTLKEI